MKKVFYFLLFVSLFTACSDSSTGNDDKNHAPEIISLVSNPDTLETGATSALTCNATDSDGDVLAFVWESDSGSINGSGSDVNWLSPDTVGTYFVTCKVLDGNGGEAIDSVKITVERKIPTEGLVAYYPFNGNANDESGNGNNGIVIGATIAKDRFEIQNKSYNFDGNDYIQVNHSQSIDGIEDNDIISLSVWVNISDWFYFTPNNPLFPILDKYESSNDFGWEFLIWNNNFQFYPSSAYTTISYYKFNLNNWYHIVSIYNRTQGHQLLYIDNVLIDSISVDQDIIDTFGEALYFGHSRSGEDEYAIGRMDDIRIYNRELNAVEVEALYYEGGWN